MLLTQVNGNEVDVAALSSEIASRRNLEANAEAEGEGEGNSNALAVLQQQLWDTIAKLEEKVAQQELTIAELRQQVDTLDRP